MHTHAGAGSGRSERRLPLAADRGVRSALTRATDRAPRATTWSTTRSDLLIVAAATPTKAGLQPVGLAVQRQQLVCRR